MDENKEIVNVHINDDKDDDHYEWRSCCLRCEKELVIYIVKYVIIFFLLAFFSFELHYANKCEDKSLFQSLLLLVIGVALPSSSALTIKR